MANRPDSLSYSLREPIFTKCRKRTKRPNIVLCVDLLVSSSNDTAPLLVDDNDLSSESSSLDVIKDDDSAAADDVDDERTRRARNESEIHCSASAIASNETATMAHDTMRSSCDDERNVIRSNETAANDNTLNASRSVYNATSASAQR